MQAIACLDRPLDLAYFHVDHDVGEKARQLFGFAPAQFGAADFDRGILPCCGACRSKREIIVDAGD